MALLGCTYKNKVSSSTKNKGNSFNAIESVACSCGEFVCGCVVNTEYPDNPGKNTYNIQRLDVARSTVMGLVLQYGGSCQ
jgi:hypothetical protein